jgi:hypothetical protein
LIDLTRLTSIELLTLHARIAEELRGRAIARTSNNPTGDLAEYLFCQAFGWKPAGNSKANIDAIARDGTRYQIKGRRITRHTKSRQLSAIRDLAGRHFDYLAGVLFTEEYRILRAALIPYAIVEQRAKFVEHTNSHKFILHDDVWTAPGVRDVTQKLTETARSLEAQHGAA